MASTHPREDLLLLLKRNTKESLTLLSSGLLLWYTMFPSLHSPVIGSFEERISVCLYRGTSQRKVEWLLTKSLSWTILQKQKLKHHVKWVQETRTYCEMKQGFKWEMMDFLVDLSNHHIVCPIKQLSLFQDSMLTADPLETSPTTPPIIKGTSVPWMLLPVSHYSQGIIWNVCIVNNDIVASWKVIIKDEMIINTGFTEKESQGGPFVLMN